jgi:fumarate reductase flavoprotein subunit
MKKISLGIGGLVAAMSWLAFQPSAEAQTPTYTHEADVVVVGAGPAGLTAALTASQGGAKVILLEKNIFPGGTGLFGEGIFGAETSMQTREAYFLTKDDAFQREMTEDNWKGNAPLLHAYINESDKTIDWLQAQGVVFSKVSTLNPGGFRSWHLIAGHHGEELIRALYFKAKEDPNIKIFLETPGKELLFDQDHQIVGVLAQPKNAKEMRIHAKAVILGTGGFGDNLDWVKQYHGDSEGGMVTPLGKVGFGIRVAQSAGAVTEGMGTLQFFPLGSIRSTIEDTNTLPLPIAAAAGEPFNVYVNAHGERFCDEALAFDFSKFGNAIDRQYKKIAWAILDRSLLERYASKGPEAGIGVLVPSLTPIPPLANWVDEQVAAGNPDYVSADNPADLAAKIHVPADHLQQTFDEYNHYVDTNYDAEFVKQKNYLHKMQGKLYAIRLVNYYLNTLGGVRVNKFLQPLDAKDEPIPHLYVTGNDVGGLYGDTYPLSLAGGTYGFAVNSARIAAKDALTRIGLSPIVALK